MVQASASSRIGASAEREHPMNFCRIVTLALTAWLLASPAVHSQGANRPEPPPKVCIGGKCVTSSSATAGATTSGPLKFHPGIYPYFNNASGVSLSRLGNGQDGKDLQLINSLTPNDNVAGIAIAILWTTIDEGTTRPNYDFSVIDAYLKAVKGVGKRLWVRVQDAAYLRNGSVANGSAVVPPWLISQYGAENVMLNYAPAPKGVSAKRYNPVVTNAYIAMLQAMAARYDADPMFEGVTMFEETALGVDTSGTAVTLSTPGADYSNDAMFAQLYSLMAAMRDPTLGFKTSNVQLSANYLFKGADSAASWTDVLNHVLQYHMMLGGPDSWIAKWTYPDLPYTGPQSAGPRASAPTNPAYFRPIFSDEVYRGWWPGTTDWRGKILFGPDAELTDTGGYITGSMNPIPTVADIWQVRTGLDHCHYFFFDIDYLPTGNYGGPAQQWSTGQYPWVQSAGPTNTTNPYN